MHSSTSRTLFLASLLASSTCFAQSTSSVVPISQIPDGQPQAPASSSASVYVNPFVTQTNSLGVVTGQPTAETSQPLPVTTQPSAVTTQPTVVTSQEPAATFESTAPGIPVGLNTTLIPVISSSATAGTSAAGNLSSRTASATRTSASSESSESATATASESSSATTGAAAAIHVAGTGLALGLAGSLFALFL